jgi:hypothetical protein
MKHYGKPSTLSVREVVMIASDERNRGKWPLGIVEELFPGRDGVIHAAKVKTSNGHLERAVNHLYPLELSCSQRQKDPLTQQLLFSNQLKMRRWQHAPESTRWPKSKVKNKCILNIEH